MAPVILQNIFTAVKPREFTVFRQTSLVTITIV